MKLYLLLVTLTIVNAGVVPDTKCDGVIIAGKYYDKEILKAGINKKDIKYGIFLNINYNYNKIYLKYLVDEDLEPALFDLNTKEMKKINVSSPRIETVDQNTDNLYTLGEGNNIYKYNYKNEKSELYASIDVDRNIRRIYFKDVLYFIESPSYFVYTYIDGNITRFKDLENTRVHWFIIDGDDDIFYSNRTGLYMQRKGCKDAVLYHNVFFYSHFTTDIHGNVYILSLDRKTLNNRVLYKVDKKNKSLQKLMDVNSRCCGLAFDANDNMIFSDCKNVVRFNIKQDKTC